MTTSSNQITTSELDFSTIKSNLMAFLSGQSTLTDYEYDGSVMSVLLDVLAYNTHYNALYTNLAINEMFIDSASKRASVISIAKLMGYMSKSVTSARAKIDISIVPAASNTSTVMTLPAGTVFGTTIGDNVYKFCTLESVSASRLNTNSAFTLNNVNLVEGKRNAISYMKTSGVDHFVIPERKADISTLKVNVFSNSSTLSNPVMFTAADSILNVTSKSNVYFIKQREDLFYEIYFGDGTFGSALTTGNVISLEYSISSGSTANKANVFVYSSGADSSSSYYITTSQVAYGGAEEESTDSIRFNAPKSFTSNHRAVTADDYTAMILGKFPTVDCVNVWGGQDNVPPVYGKVFIAAKPVGRDTFSTAEKTSMISTLLSKTSIITVKPEFVDPSYLEVALATNVYYDPKLTVRGSGEIASLVLGRISDYASTLGKFDTVYRHSLMSRMIDNTEKSIISNISNIMVNYTLNPYYGKTHDYVIAVGNPISGSADAVVKTSKFYHVDHANPCFISNTGTLLNLYTLDDAGLPVYVSSVGSYSTDGIIFINKLNIVGLYDMTMKISFTPYSYDVVPINNYIVRLVPSMATVNIIVDNIEMNASGAQTHVFSGSR